LSLVKTDKFFTPLVLPKFCNDFVEVDFFGKFVKYSFTDEMCQKDRILKDEVKQQKKIRTAQRFRVIEKCCYKRL
jgi:hypothetical protein